MKLPLINLVNLDAKLFTTEAGWSVQTASGRSLHFGKYSPDPRLWDEVEAARIPPAAKAVQLALQSVLTLDQAASSITRDGRLTALGKQEKLAPLKDHALRTMGQAHHVLREQRDGLVQHKSQHYAVPTPTANDMVGYMRERENRDYLRSLSKADQLRFLDGNEAAIHAVLRSPITHPLAPTDVERVALEKWHSVVDDRDPQQRARFDLADQTLDWAEAVVGQTRVRLTQDLDMKREQLLERAHAANAAQFFGFTVHDVAMADLKAERAPS